MTRTAIRAAVGLLIATVGVVGVSLAASAMPDRGGVSVVALPAVAAGEPEFIELTYWEGVLLEGASRTVEPVEQCDTTPDRQVCEFEQSFDSVATHLGLARDVSTGTITTMYAETCLGNGGAPGNPVITEGSGTIETIWGDKLFFRNRADDCTTAIGLAAPGYFVIDGGTGRFQDASGVMSTVGPVLDSGYISMATGILRVRADLWTYLPGDSVSSAVVTPGVGGVTEGDSGQTIVDVPVTLSFPLAEPVTVNWSTLDTGAPGVATADIDYVAAAGTVTFAPGETERTVSITVNGDTVDEPPLLYGEWGLVQFSDPSPNAIVTSQLEGQGVFIIVDDD